MPLTNSIRLSSHANFPLLADGWINYCCDGSVRQWATLIERAGTWSTQVSAEVKNVRSSSFCENLQDGFAELLEEKRGCLDYSTVP